MPLIISKEFDALAAPAPTAAALLAQVPQCYGVAMLLRCMFLCCIQRSVYNVCYAESNSAQNATNLGRSSKHVHTIQQHLRNNNSKTTTHRKQGFVPIPESDWAADINTSRFTIAFDPGV
jgi:hypothetical protein